MCTRVPYSSVSELPGLRKFRRARQGIDASKLTKGDGKKKKRRTKPDDGEEEMPVGRLRPGGQVSDPTNLILSMILRTSTATCVFNMRGCCLLASRRIKRRRCVVRCARITLRSRPKTSICTYCSPPDPYRSSFYSIEDTEIIPYM